MVARDRRRAGEIHTLRLLNAVAQSEDHLWAFALRNGGECGPEAEAGSSQQGRIVLASRQLQYRKPRYEPIAPRVGVGVAALVGKFFPVTSGAGRP